eukprot:102427-Prorocentrum_minimum.AAC.1
MTDDRWRASHFLLQGCTDERAASAVMGAAWKAVVAAHLGPSGASHKAPAPSHTGGGPERPHSGH